MSNSTVVETYQRRIAGYAGILELEQNERYRNSWRGKFWMRAKISCRDLTEGRPVRVQITALDYTREEFDRILDTFSIEHYVREP
jgi:hypothetical protein